MGVMAHRHEHSELIDAVGSPKVRTHFALRPQTLNWWRIRGVPLSKRVAFARLANESGVTLPSSFVSEVYEKLGLTA